MFIFINSSMWKCHHNSNRWRVQWLEPLFIRVEVINGFFISKFIRGHLYQISYKLWTRRCHLQLCDPVTSEHKYMLWCIYKYAMYIYVLLHSDPTPCSFQINSHTALHSIERLTSVLYITSECANSCAARWEKCEKKCFSHSFWICVLTNDTL